MPNFDYVSFPIEEVMDDIERFVIPENIRAIEYLWDMNIVTYMNNNYDNETSWITIGKLSKENRNIFNKIINERNRENSKLRLPYVGYGPGGIIIEINVKPQEGGIDTFEQFKELIDLFMFQDVQSDGYITLDEFLILYTDHFKRIINPCYIDSQMGLAKKIDSNKKDYPPFVSEEQVRRLGELHESSSTIRVPYIAGSENMTQDEYEKAIYDILEEKGVIGLFDPSEKKIFRHKRLYDGHMRFKNQQITGVLKK